MRLGLSVAGRDWSSDITGCGGIGFKGEGSRTPNMHSVTGSSRLATMRPGRISRGSDGISGMGDKAVDLSSGSGV